MSSLTLGHKRNKSLKSSKTLHKLLISAPISDSQCSPISPTVRSPLAGPVVILRARFDFEAQAIPEISVRSQELFMPIERRDDGWIHVQLLDRNAKGLIPSLYAEIVVNDPNNPVTMDWYSGAMEGNIINKYRIDRTIVSQVLLNETHRLCYKVEAVIESDRIIKCCKIYEDFNDLLNLVNKKFGSIKQFSIPAQLVSHVSPIKCSETTKRDIMTVALGLKSFILDLTRFLTLRDNLLLADFLLKDTTNLRLKSSKTLSTAPLILDLLNQNLGGLLPIQRSQSFSPTAPLPLGSRPITKRCASSPKESDSYKSTNIKYLAYLASIQQNRTEKFIASVPQSESITSILSLIESYDVSSWDVYDEGSQSSGIGRLHGEDRPNDLSAHHNFHPLHSLSSGTEMKSGNSLWSEVSEPNSAEPITPPLGHQSLASLVLPIQENGTAQDFDFSPLKPQMHQEFLKSPGQMGQAYE